MARGDGLAAFSRNRLGGEPVPDDVKALLAHADEFAKRTGIELNGEEGWAPWLDTSYLSAADRTNPDITANVRAMAEVCGLIAFIAATEEGEYFGYWRGTGKRAVAASPLVRLDNEGQFNLCGCTTFAEAVLGETYGDEKIEALREWFRSLGIALKGEEPAEEEQGPDELHSELYYRYRKEAGLE
jgi:hypothetical protein